MKISILLKRGSFFYVGYTWIKKNITFTWLSSLYKPFNTICLITYINIYCFTFTSFTYPLPFSGYFFIMTYLWYVIAVLYQAENVCAKLQILHLDGTSDKWTLIITSSPIFSYDGMTALTSLKTMKTFLFWGNNSQLCPVQRQVKKSHYNKHLKIL